MTRTTRLRLVDDAIEEQACLDEVGELLQEAEASMRRIHEELRALARLHQAIAHIARRRRQQAHQRAGLLDHGAAA